MTNRSFVHLSTIEYCAAGAMFGWGLWILLWGPGAALSAPAFDILRQSVAPFPAYRIYGGGAAIVGTLYAVAVTINGSAMYWTPAARVISCLVAVLFLANLTVAIFAAQPSSTGVYTYGTLAILYFALLCANLNRLAVSIDMIWSRVHDRWR